jgi:predicted nucleic acid-binding protein
MTREVVADCSVTASWFIPDERTSSAEKLLKDAVDGKVLLVEPVLWHYETVNLLRTAVKRGRLSEQSARKALHLLNEIPMTFVDPGKQGDFEILRLSLDCALSAYDAAYLHLAETHGIELLTSDGDLLRLSSQFSWIIPFSGY